jgi:hypothetical protein
MMNALKAGLVSRLSATFIAGAKRKMNVVKEHAKAGQMMNWYIEKKDCAIGGCLRW